MRKPICLPLVLGLTVGLFAAVGCDDDGSEAVLRGVGAACGGPGDCPEEGQTCLPFKNGYCGVADCTKNQDCPDGSACVTHTDSKNYCFLICTDKPQCNVHRPVEAEANCVSSVTFVEAAAGKKACEPPSG
jgi:hypothetical protein